MRIVCISDTHNRLGEMRVPDGDILIHAGDGTLVGRVYEIKKWGRELSALPHKHKIVIAGNHDLGFQDYPSDAYNWLNPPDMDGWGKDRTIHYLEHQSIEIEGLRIFGSPWTPWYHDWAFNGPENQAEGREAMEAKWDKIPDKLDILVTHGPPRGIMDQTRYGDNVGCQDLEHRVYQVRPKLHVFGHIHEGYGQMTDGDYLGVKFVNASSVNKVYEPVNEPIVIDL